MAVGHRPWNLQVLHTISIVSLITSAIPIVLDGEKMAPKWLPKWVRISLGQKMSKNDSGSH
jgi:hypothetical protein